MQLFYARRNCAIIIQLLRTVCIIVSSKMCIERNHHVTFYGRTSHLLFYNYFTVYKCIVHWSTIIVLFLLLINNHLLRENSFCQNTKLSVHSISNCWQLLNACNAMAWQGSKAACQRWWKSREAEKRVVKNHHSTLFYIFLQIVFLNYFVFVIPVSYLIFLIDIIYIILILRLS